MGMSNRHNSLKWTSVVIFNLITFHAKAQKKQTFSETKTKKKKLFRSAEINTHSLFKPGGCVCCLLYTYCSCLPFCLRFIFMALFSVNAVFSGIVARLVKPFILLCEWRWEMRDFKKVYYRFTGLPFILIFLRINKENSTIFHLKKRNFYDQKTKSIVSVNVPILKWNRRVLDFELFNILRNYFSNSILRAKSV